MQCTDCWAMNNHQISAGACALALATKQGNMPLNSKHCRRAHARHSLLLLVMLSQLLHSKLCVLRVHLYTDPRCTSHLPDGTHRSHPAGRGQRQRCSTRPGCSHCQSTMSWLGSAHPQAQRSSHLGAAPNAAAALAAGSTCPVSSGSAPADEQFVGIALPPFPPWLGALAAGHHCQVQMLQKVRAGGWPWTDHPIHLAQHPGRRMAPASMSAGASLVEACAQALTV